MPKIDNQTLELALFILVAVAMLVQAIALLGIFFVVRKTAKAATKKLDAVHRSVTPIIESSRDLLAKVKPNIESTTEHVAAISQSLRAQTADIQSATTDIVARTKIQAGRVDGMVGKLLDGVDHAGVVVADCVNKPLRQFNAVLASVKAVIDSLRNSTPVSGSRADRASGDGEMFL